MNFPKNQIPIQKLMLGNEIELFVKREDQTHLEVSGNKYWKLFYNINTYLEQQPSEPMLITFGGAFSNHIAATAALARDLEIPALGVIRGEEIAEKWQENHTLKKASQDGMQFHFVTREAYRDKEKLSEILQKQYPNALIIPEGGTNSLAVEGVQHMLDERTKDFDYLCTAVGTGGTVAGLSKFAESHQKVLGFKVVKDNSVDERIVQLSGRENVTLFDASLGGYGKINEDNLLFIKNIKEKFDLPLDPIYTGKMLQHPFLLIEQGYFEKGAKILAFHTGGLQGGEGILD